MTTKAKALQKKTPAKASDKNMLAIKHDNEKSKERQLAEIGLSANILNAATARDFTKSIVGEIDFTEATAVMKEKVNKVKAGDLAGLEGTLTAQVTSLDTMFSALAMRGNNSDTMSKLEIYMRLALKAQAQCARTIEVLATMKNPPVIFAKQANIAQGNQQVNNGSLNNNSPAHAGKTVNQSNELLEVNHGNTTMDFRAETATSGKDKAVAAVDTIDRG